MPIVEVTEPMRYHKPIVLPERLDLLTGPTTGMFTDWQCSTTPPR